MLYDCSTILVIILVYELQLSLWLFYFFITRPFLISHSPLNMPDPQTSKLSQTTFEWHTHHHISHFFQSTRIRKSYSSLFRLYTFSLRVQKFKDLRIQLLQTYALPEHNIWSCVTWTVFVTSYLHISLVFFSSFRSFDHLSQTSPQFWKRDSIKCRGWKNCTK